MDNVITEQEFMDWGGDYFGFKVKVAKNEAVNVGWLESVKDNESTIINMGLQITALDIKDGHLVVGGSQLKKLHLVDKITTCKNSILVWKVDDCCELVASINHEFGDILAMEWCLNSKESEHQLGLLACTFTDGFLRVFVVPRANTMKHCLYF